jgi:hypothetical protein
MNIQDSRNHDRLLHGIAATLLLICFGFGDTAVIAWSASVASFGQLTAAAVALTLIGAGVLFTVWQMRR